MDGVQLEMMSAHTNVLRTAPTQFDLQDQLGCSYGLQSCASLNDPIQKKRGSRAQPLPPDAWERHKDLIKCLFLDQNKSLREVRATLENNHVFKASHRQYKSQVQKWGWQKNIKKKEMRKMFRIQKKRKRDGKDTVFRRKKDGQSIPQDKLSRWRQRNASDLEARETLDEDWDENFDTLSDISIITVTPERQTSEQESLGNGKSLSVSIQEEAQCAWDLTLSTPSSIAYRASDMKAPAEVDYDSENGEVARCGLRNPSLTITGEHQAYLPTETPKTFGCPYRIRNSGKFGIVQRNPCCTQEHVSIASVIEHLKGCHRPLFLITCVICTTICFSAQQLKECYDKRDFGSHSTLRDNESEDGLDTDQYTNAKTWDELWSILFPNDKEPLPPDFGSLITAHDGKTTSKSSFPSSLARMEKHFDSALPEAKSNFSWLALEETSIEPSAITAAGATQIPSSVQRWIINPDSQAHPTPENTSTASWEQPVDVPQPIAPQYEPVESTLSTAELLGSSVGFHFPREHDWPEKLSQPWSFAFPGVPPNIWPTEFLRQ